MMSRAESKPDARMLFVHDHHFIPYKGEVYSEVQYDAHHWLRYLDVFTELMVVGRDSELRLGLQPERLLRSSRSGVSFTLLPSLSGVGAQLKQRATVTRRMRELIAHVGWVVARVPSELGLVAISVARELGKPCLVEVVDCAWDGLWHYGDWQGKVYAPVMAWRVRRAVAQATWVQYVTRDFLQQRYPNKSRGQLSCSNVEIAPPDTSVLARRMERINRGFVDQAFTLGLIGTLATRHKGIQTVLAALPRLLVRFPHLTFRVLGGGDPAPWQAEAKRLGVADRVYFDGVLPAGPAVMAWLDQIDLYVHPSFKEGLPRALIEAMSRGCPAIASRVGGIPELLGEGCLMDAGHVNALTSLASRLLDSQEQLVLHAQRNFQVAGVYNREILQGKRRDFLHRFRDETARMDRAE